MRAPAAATARPAARSGVLALLVLAVVVAVAAMHSLVLDAATHTGAGHAMVMDAAGPSGHALSATRATAAAAAAVEPPMTGCANHPCLLTRTDGTVAPALVPVLVTVLGRPWLWASSAPGLRSGVRRLRAPPRDGPRSPLCVWRV